MSQVIDTQSAISQSVNQRYNKLVSALLVLWFIAAVSASALLMFNARSKTVIPQPLPLGLAVLVPVVIFLLWMAASPQFREFVLSRDARLLTLVQAWRIGGFTFLVLAAHHILPTTFALPAGWGDIAVGATAPFVAKYLLDPRQRTGFVAWQIVGMLDLITAVTLGVLSSPTPIGILAHGVTTEAMSVLPLSLIPTFAVPLLFIFHIICVTQAARGKIGSGAEQRLRSAVS